MIKSEIIIDSLLEFYKFQNKMIISVGAGGGQLIEYGRASKGVIAVDNDAAALCRLKDNLLKKKLDDKFTLVHSDFYSAGLKGDAVLFEFCLHEMKDAEAAVRHAKTIAPDIVIADHWPGSEWAYIADEKEKVERSWQAIDNFQIKKKQRYETVQIFADYEELYEKVKVQGVNSVNRISRYKGISDIRIPMSFGFCLI